MSDEIDELQSQLTGMAVAEVNKLRRTVAALQKELISQIPTIWWQQEQIVLLKNQLSKAMLAIEGSKG